MYKSVYYQKEKNLVHVWDDKKGYFSFPYKNYAYELSLNGEYLSIFGDRLTKVYEFDKDNPELFESDVPETTRILVDLYNENDEVSENIKILTLDIEVEMNSGLPDSKVASNDITAIGFHTTESDEYTVLLWDQTGTMKSIEIGNTTVIPFKTEKELLRYFLEVYEELRADIITGWNIDNFDMPYLYNRLINVLGKHQANRLSPIGHTFYSTYRDRLFIAGVSCLDYIELYKQYNFGELPNYRLDTVAQIELGRGKIEYPGNLDDLLRTDVNRFIEYLFTDVELVVSLDKKLQFIDLCRGICHVGHVPYEDFVYSSKYLEGSLLTYLRKRNLVACNKPADRKERMKALHEAGAEKFIGAYVKDPIVGKYDWVYDLDLTSLYPSIIMSLNISPETKIGKITNWDAEKYLRATALSTFQIGSDILTFDEFNRYITTEKIAISSNGVMYRTDIVGCIPGILDDWFKKRVEYNDLKKKYGKEKNQELFAFYDKRQLVQKILLNSLYGVLGLPAFRFYDLDNAEAVTTSGQTVIKSTANMINIKYNKEINDNRWIEVTDESESGHTKRFRFTERVNVIRDGNTIQIQANELIENDYILNI